MNTTMKAGTMKGAALFLALSAIPFAASAQDWRGDHHGRDRGGQQQQQQPSDGNTGNNGGQQHDRGGNGRGWGGRDNGSNDNGNRDGNRGWANRDNGNNNGRGWGDRGGWQRNGGNGYAPRPQMPPPQANNYYGRGNYSYRGYDRDRDYRYAPPPRVYYPNRGRGYYSVGYGYRPEPVWTVGNVYYVDDYAPTYAVDDYGDYGLYAPPRGYGWRRDDFGHYLLVAITSGIIADLLFGH